MIEKPDKNFLCDDFGTYWSYNSDMCRCCNNFVFCLELHERIPDWIVWAIEQDEIAKENGWERRYLK